VGEGLLTFTDRDTAVLGAQKILSEYPVHSAAARRLAETCFASDLVLASFLERARVE
jgi:hypothetical protein